MFSEVARVARFEVDFALESASKNKDTEAVGIENSLYGSRDYCIINIQDNASNLPGNLYWVHNNWNNYTALPRLSSFAG